MYVASLVSCGRQPSRRSAPDCGSTGSAKRANARRLASDSPRLTRQRPLPPDRRRRTRARAAVSNVLVRVRQHAAEQPVELVGGDGVQRERPDQVDVAELVDAEVHAVHPRVALEQVALEHLVVLVRVPDTNASTSRLWSPTTSQVLVSSLCVPGQADEERALGRVLVRQLALVEDAATTASSSACGPPRRVPARRSRVRPSRPGDGSSRRRRWSSTAPVVHVEHRGSGRRPAERRPRAGPHPRTARRAAAAREQVAHRVRPVPRVVARRPGRRSARRRPPSRSPPTAAATTGVPQACASRATSPNDSLYDGTTDDVGGAVPVDERRPAATGGSKRTTSRDARARPASSARCVGCGEAGPARAADDRDDQPVAQRGSRARRSSGGRAQQHVRAP